MTTDLIGTPLAYLVDPRQMEPAQLEEYLAQGRLWDPRAKQFFSRKNPEASRYRWTRRTPHVNWPAGVWLSYSHRGYEQDMSCYARLPCMNQDGYWFVTADLGHESRWGWPPQLFKLDDFLSRWGPQDLRPGVRRVDPNWVPNDPRSVRDE